PSLLPPCPDQALGCQKGAPGSSRFSPCPRGRPPYPYCEPAGRSGPPPFKERRLMYAVRLALVGTLVLGLAFTARADDKDKKKDDSIKTKLVGTWVVEEGKGLAKGDTLQFTKDGKVTVTHKRDDKERKVQGTYKVEG